MRHWNYRVIEFVEEDERWRAIHVVYYDDNGHPIHFDEDPAAASSNVVESVNGLKAELWAFNGALIKNVLLASEFPTITTVYSSDGDVK